VYFETCRRAEPLLEHVFYNMRRRFSTKFFVTTLDLTQDTHTTTLGGALCDSDLKRYVNLYSLNEMTSSSPRHSLVILHVQIRLLIMHA
jgi:hypothetical protein